MTNLSLEMPDDLMMWAQSRAKEGNFARTVDFLLDLVRQDQNRATQSAELDRELAKGLASGRSPRSADEILTIARSGFVA
ncbi:MAG: hypothetical protein QM537_01575 [Candidatus Symbiobacter sp.]|nr:hypothetical protein [Candidatus Symbiobacter sp.]